MSSTIKHEMRLVAETTTDQELAREEKYIAAGMDDTQAAIFAHLDGVIGKPSKTPAQRPWPQGTPNEGVREALKICFG